MFAYARTSLKPAGSLLRSFSTTRPAADLAKVTLIGRLGADPVKRETSAGKPYYTYPLATNTGSPKTDAEGKIIGQNTNWHTVFAFNESSHAGLANVGKGSTLFVEADFEMRPAEPSADGTPVHERVLLRHRSMSVISRVRAAAEEEGEHQAE